MAQYRYKQIRIVCQGIVKTCKHCKDTEFQEGYCKLCSRPLWKKSGDKCNHILGYAERDDDGQFKKQGKLHIKCTYCNTLTTI